MEIRSRHITDFYIAGMRYWDGAFIVGELKPGENLTLVPEPQNPHDCDAVAIYWEDTKLGYVPCDENDFLAQLLCFGHVDVIECRILKVDPKGEPYKQVRVGLYVIDKRHSESE